ncbi:hydroxysqualene synthase [Comamonadaceae bacterium OS-1]|nr:hydroxysqualene synthase [Comamonadaceae bacterium OS-1]
MDHYENFPVASVLCPAHLRPPIAAIYWFARTADDLADEGDAPAAQRLADLAAFRADLADAAAGRSASSRWPQVFGPLQAAIAAWKLPEPLLADLLSAFKQDVIKNDEESGYADRAELLDYCQRSAAPVGRLLLHLYGVEDAQSLQHSDAICNALQLINFWQDLSRDLPRGRFYLPQDRSQHHGVDAAALAHNPQSPALTRLMEENLAWARALMRSGAPLVHRVPGRAGWELRLVVQGGLRILDKIEALGCATRHVRPTVGKADIPVMLWRALWM